MINTPIKYPANLKKEGKFYNITFPDFPEALTYGDGVEDALNHAQDAIETVLLHKIQAREKIPAPKKANKKQKLISLSPSTAAKLFLYWEMQQQSVRKSDLAKKLNKNQKQIDRLLDISHHSTLAQLEMAMNALGKRLVITVE